MENRAGRAELSERIIVEAPEDHPLRGEVELCWWSDGTLSLEYQSAVSVDAVAIHRIEHSGQEFQVQLVRDW